VLDSHLYPVAETLTIYFVDEVPALTGLLVTIKYSTSLLTGSSGFYRTSYVMNGVTRYLGATQFESTNARYAFPHYDEPGYKVPIELKITHFDGYKAIANMPETEANK
jgi:aminopeptidase N